MSRHLLSIVLVGLAALMALPLRSADALPQSPSCKLRSAHVDGITAGALSGMRGLKGSSRYPVYSCGDGSWRVAVGLIPIITGFGAGSSNSILAVLLPSPAHLRFAVEQASGRREVHTRAFGTVRVPVMKTLESIVLGSRPRGIQQFHFPLKLHGRHLPPGTFAVVVKATVANGQMSISLPVVISVAASGTTTIVASGR